MKSISLTLLSIVALCSCTTEVANIPIAFTKPIDPSATYSIAQNESITGMACERSNVISQYSIGGGTIHGNTALDAIELATKKAGPTCVGMANIKIEHGYSYAVYYEEEYYTATGNPIYKK